MAYLGTSPVAGKFQKIDDISSGFDDSETSFTLQAGGADIAAGSVSQQLLVSIDGVLQEPVNAFTLTGSTINFTEAPNTNATFFAVLLGDVGTINTLGDQVLATANYQDLSVSTAKLAANAVTQPKLAADAVHTPQLADGNVTLAKLAPGVIPVINAANIENNAVETAKIQDDAVTNLKISPNIVLRGTTTFMGAAVEKANIIASNVGSTGEIIDIDNQDNGVIFFTGNSYSNSAYTVNFINMDHIEVGNAASFVVMLTNNLDHQANINAVQINGDASNNFFFSGGLPVTGSANIDVYSFSVLKTGTSAYTTIASLTNFT